MRTYGGGGGGERRGNGLEGGGDIQPRGGEYLLGEENGARADGEAQPGGVLAAKARVRFAVHQDEQPVATQAVRLGLAVAAAGVSLKRNNVGCEQRAVRRGGQLEGWWGGGKGGEAPR